MVCGSHAIILESFHERFNLSDLRYRNLPTR